MYYAGSFGPKRLLNDELRQLDEEGFIVSDELKNEALQFEDDSSFELHDVSIISADKNANIRLIFM